MQRFSPQPLCPAPRGSSTEEMAAWRRGSGPQGCGVNGKHRGSRDLTAAADPWTDLMPVTPCPGQPPAPGAATPRATLSLDHRRCQHIDVPLTMVGRLLAFCQEGHFASMDFSHWDLLGMMDFSRRMSRSDLVAGLGGSRARASPCTQGTRGLWKPGFLVAAGYASRLECWRQGQLLFPETVLSGFGAGCSRCWRQERPLPQPSRELAAGESRNVSERGKKKKTKTPKPSPPQKNHFCYNLSFMRVFCSN